jgi:predicted nucleic acid-binding protein
VALVLDTGVVVAALMRDDRHHAACRRLIDETSEMLILPSPVLPEIDYWVSRIGPGAMIGLLGEIETGSFVVEDLEDEDYARVAQLVDRYSDQDLGFVDAAVLAVVERLGERTLATLDHRHFSVIRPRHLDVLELVP